MTIVFDPTVAAALAANDTSNNPIILWDNVAAELGVSITTSVGTEIESAALTATGSTYDPWVVQPTAAGDAAFEVVFSAAQTLNAVGVAAHNLSVFTPVVRVQYSNDGGSNWIDSGAGPVSQPDDNNALLFYFSEQTSTHWRFIATQATQPGGATVDLFVGNVVWGNVTTMPQRLYQGYVPPVVPSNVALQSNISDTGHFLGDAVVRRGSSADPTITHLTSSFVRSTDFKGFMNHFNSGDNFFWAWRPTDLPREVFYAKRARDTLRPRNTGPLDFMSVEMNMRFYDDP